MAQYRSTNSEGVISARDMVTGEAFYVEGTSATGAINVNAEVSIGGTLDSNITEVGGDPITLGQTTAADSFPVVIASDQSPIKTLEQTGLVPEVYDAITYTDTSSTIDTYDYYTGGTGGTLVSTVTVTWTDSTKSVLVSVART